MPGNYRQERNQNRRIKNLEKNVHKIKTSMETKYFDTAPDVFSVSNAGTLSLLNAVPIGDEQNRREGAQVRATSVRIQLGLTAGNSGLINHLLRIIVFWDAQANGAQPNVSGSPLAGVQALLDSASIFAGTSLLNAQYQRETNDRFTVLYDKTYRIHNWASGQDTPLRLDKKIPLSRLVKYGDDGTTVASLNTNALYILYICPTSSAITVQQCSRFNFKDN